MNTEKMPQSPVNYKSNSSLMDAYCKVLGFRGSCKRGYWLQAAKDEAQKRGMSDMFVRLQREASESITFDNLEIRG